MIGFQKILPNFIFSYDQTAGTRFVPKLILKSQTRPSLENIFFQSEMDAVSTGKDVPFSYDEAFLPNSTAAADNKSDSDIDTAGSGLKSGGPNEDGKNCSNNERPKKSEFKIREENDKIRQRYFQKLDQAEYRKMLDQRKLLPAWTEREKIVKVLETSQVVVISGMTGCGKRLNF